MGQPEKINKRLTKLFVNMKQAELRKEQRAKQEKRIEDAQVAGMAASHLDFILSKLRSSEEQIEEEEDARPMVKFTVHYASKPGMYEQYRGTKKVEATSIEGAKQAVFSKLKHEAFPDRSFDMWNFDEITVGW